MRNLWVLIALGCSSGDGDGPSESPMSDSAVSQTGTDTGEDVPQRTDTGDAPPLAGMETRLGPADALWGIDDLHCEVMLDPPDAALAATATYRWTVDGAPSGLTEPVVDADTVRDGTTWACTPTLTTTDGPLDLPEASITPQVAGGNLIVILIDDVGVDKIGAYGLHPSPPPTPRIDALAAEGVLFRRGYANPTCSPTRASLLTGRYSRRTGIGQVIWDDPTDVPLPDSEILIPELLATSPLGYRSALAGKWHLNNDLGVQEALDHPARAGFDNHIGPMANPGWGVLSGGPRGYDNWEENNNGLLSRKRGYLTTATTDDAITATQASEPFFLYLAYNSAHIPLHFPPEELHSYPLVQDADKWYKHHAMVEALDTEIGRLIDSIDPDVLSRTTILLMGDNGGTRSERQPPEVEGGDKGSVLEGGVHVPFVAWGHLVREPGRQSDAFVHVVDVFESAMVLAGVDIEAGDQALRGRSVPRDGVNLLPYLRDPDRASRREYLYSEDFGPNGRPPYRNYTMAIRNARYKLRAPQETGPAWFIDLEAHPLEDVQVGPYDLTADQQLIYDELFAELERIRTEIVYDGP